GSTLTMQTSENLFHPGARSPEAKLWELVDTWRLETHYSKEDILEFYANQFHVYGNGRGLGIAARYFFDKDVTELDIQECAFIAGLVKIPARYNPFIGGTEERRQEAREKAQTRVRYVLGRMHTDGHITAEQLKLYSERPIPFKKGTFRYDSSILMDEVERRLEAAPFPELMAAAGIDNPSTAGIRIITTLDAGAQRAATYGLWHHLAEVGPGLEGLSVSDWFHDAAKAPRPDPNSPPERFGFRYATITGTTDDGVTLDLGGFPGRLDAEAMDRAAYTLALAAGGDRYAKPSKTLRGLLAESMSEGRVVWVSIRDKDGDTWLCDLEARPELQGAVVVLEDGQLRAMVGGNDNRNFNRALSAQRQLGSTWKVLVYNAALQLGWAPTDTLDNRRGVFPFTGTWYYPRPDHKSEDFVSMAWAGVRSENLATIWLLYHLVDRLNPEQVRRLAELTDLARRKGESQKDYTVRIRDEHGVIATADRVPEGLFLAVKEQVIADLSFTGHPEDAAELRSLHYGRGFAAERTKVRRGSGGEEREAKLFALEANLLDLEAMLPACLAQVKRVREAEAPLIPAEVNQLSVRLVDGRFKLNCGRAPEGWAPVGESLAERLGEPDLPAVDPDPLLHSRIHASTVQAVRAAIDERAGKLAGVDPYDPELLYLHPDFRLVLGMRYLAGLAERMGVESELPPVLSMPLGAVDVTLAEMAGIYQGFLKGERWTFPGEGYEPSTVPGLRSSFDLPAPEGGGPLLILEIRDRDNNVLYRAQPEPERVADPVAGRLTTDILYNVVAHGTGRRASALTPGIPLAGKTGTTNSFKNAAFLGFAPIIEDDALDPTRGFTVAAYVGYDDNRPMTRNNLRLAGASGALPAWMGTVHGLYQLGLMGEPPTIPVAPLEDGFTRVAAADLSGLPQGPATAEDPRQVLVLSPADNPSRRFAPFAERAQKASVTEEALPVDLGLVQDPEPGTLEVEQAPEDDTGLDIDPRLGAPPSIWDDIAPEIE
ncbi:MAG: transglycosylase domain-containing protein, partial [Alphaproteobacteria bacterium]|nr:transglycosylase domain-containing protein [Alphaproteobacteria bacterium]